jgi:hypothetical protein
MRINVTGGSGKAGRLTDLTELGQVHDVVRGADAITLLAIGRASELLGHEVVHRWQDEP